MFSKTLELDIKGKYFPSRNTYGFMIRDKNAINFANKKLMFPSGSKSLIVKIPIQIFEDFDLIKRFLRGYFDTDGSFSCFKKSGNYNEFKRKYHAYLRLSFLSVSLNLSNDLKKIFHYLDIKFYFRTYKSKIPTVNLKYIFEFNGVKRTEKLMKIMIPKNSTKHFRHLIWKRFSFCPTNLTFKQRLKILKGELNPYILYKDP